MSSNSQFKNYRPLDAELIKDVEKILSKLNISQTFAIELYYNEIARTGKLPLNVEIPNEETLKAILDTENKKNSKTFNSLEALMDDLNDKTIIRTNQFKKDYKLALKQNPYCRRKITWEI